VRVEAEFERPERQCAKTDQVTESAKRCGHRCLIVLASGPTNAPGNDPGLFVGENRAHELLLRTI